MLHSYLIILCLGSDVSSFIESDEKDAPYHLVAF